MLNIFIYAAAVLFALICLRLWQKRKVTNDVGDMMRKVMVAWAAQGPFKTGAESSRAMRYGFLAAIDVEAAKNFEQTITAHEHAFNSDPAHWNSLIPIQQATFHKDREKIIERLNQLLSGGSLSDETLNEIRDSHSKDSNLSKLAEYLIEIKDRKPVEAFDERRIAFHGLNWSEHSGAYEQHLKRRSNNPLFPKDRRLVTQVDVDAAISMDTIEAIELDEKYRALLERISHCKEKIEISDANQLREESEDLISQCDQIGDKVSLIRNRLTELRSLIVEAWISAYPPDSPERQKLIDLEQHRKENNDIVYVSNILSQQISRGDVIPSDEILLAMMSDNEELLRYWYQQADDQFKEQLKSEAIRTIRTALEDGLPEEKAHRILNALS